MPGQPWASSARQNPGWAKGPQGPGVPSLSPGVCALLGELQAVAPADERCPERPRPTGFARASLSPGVRVPTCGRLRRRDPPGPAETAYGLKGDGSQGHQQSSPVCPGLAGARGRGGTRGGHQVRPGADQAPAGRDPWALSLPRTEGIGLHGLRLLQRGRGVRLCLLRILCSRVNPGSQSPPSWPWYPCPPPSAGKLSPGPGLREAALFLSPKCQGWFLTRSGGGPQIVYCYRRPLPSPAPSSRSAARRLLGSPSVPRPGHVEGKAPQDPAWLLRHPVQNPPRRLDV